MSQNVFTFGKHKGESFRSVFQKDQGYVEWAMAQKNANGGLRDFVEWCRNQNRDDKGRDDDDEDEEEEEEESGSEEEGSEIFENNEEDAMYLLQDVIDIVLEDRELEKARMFDDGVMCLVGVKTKKVSLIDCPKEEELAKHGNEYDSEEVAEAGFLRLGEEQGAFNFLINNSITSKKKKKKKKKRIQTQRSRDSIDCFSKWH